MVPYYERPHMIPYYGKSPMVPYSGRPHLVYGIVQHNSGNPDLGYNPNYYQQGYSNQVVPWYYIKGEELGISMQTRFNLSEAM